MSTRELIEQLEQLYGVLNDPGRAAEDARRQARSKVRSLIAQLEASLSTPTPHN